MAKVIITIEDLPGNRVKVTATPNFETMMQMQDSGTRLTSAHGYALFALNQIRQRSQQLGPLAIQVPRIGK